ncbi:alpha/beta hydrolase [Paenimyroides baculatum]|uniref:Alpha/beta hydrolase n=1 Tax=Paenimyroides baculatum TaxID=2608000 RepID=A0A5M6CK59_9FLAO|nr:alpha/beta hydrolase [Paenimyroides baculatum]KAA5534362.1 alpha/beta hydrolase [Paenimyroides baculatum]
MRKIYIFSGLGVDKRVFDNIDFSDLNIAFVDWIDPIKNETFESYAKRISKDFEKDAILIGLSFGGMLAVEVSKIIPVKKVILIASAKNKSELPKWFLLAGKLKLNRIVPSSLLKTTNFITNWLFGATTSTEKLLLKNIIKDTDPRFLKWAVDQIVNWKNLSVPQNCIRIHGTNDRILPAKYLKVDYKIKNGGHFMTVNKAKEIEVIIKKLCC